MAAKRKLRKKPVTRDSMPVSQHKLGNFLVSEGMLGQEQLFQALKEQRSQGGSLKQAVLGLGLVTEDKLIETIVSKDELNIHFKRLGNLRDIDETVLRSVPAEFAHRNRVIPLTCVGSLLTVAMSDPFDAAVLERLKSMTRCTVLPMIARESEIDAALKSQYGELAQPKAAPELPAYKPEDVKDAIARQYEEEIAHAQVVHVEAGVSEKSAPIIRLSTELVEEAHKKRASDIHIEPFEGGTIVRFRVDGVLHVHMTLPLAAIRALVSRYKIMAELDIAEQRLPQDGRIEFKRFSQEALDLDLRVSTIPVAFGEKIVMRLLDKKSAIIGLEGMGFSEGNLKVYRWAIGQPYGMVLHVGPTGSGKTTTLYAALSEINSPELNIQTAEDPVEYMLQQVNQTQMRHDIGLDFARALRAFLRQDPDVIMVGEIRDIETASIAVEAALTGHLLFSTLHTNDAVGTVVRLIEMGLEPFLVSSSLLLVCAQRLMRKLCTCRQPDAPDSGEKDWFKYYEMPTDGLKVYRHRGCGECGNTGYRGRLGTHEVLTMTPELHELVNSRASDEQLRNTAMKGGMVPIFQDAIGKVAEGLTSFEEAVRVVRAR